MRFMPLVYLAVHVRVVANIFGMVPYFFTVTSTHHRHRRPGALVIFT